MNDKTEASPEWESAAVLKRLEQTTLPGQPSQVQVFLTDAVSVNDLAQKAKEIVDDTSARLNLPEGAVKIGKVHRLAKSFSVSSDVAKVFDAIARRDEVKSILESAQADIYPKPTDR